MSNDVLYGLLVIAGFIILGGVIIYARATNRVSRRQFEETEAATRRLYDEKQPARDEAPR